MCKTAQPGILSCDLGRSSSCGSEGGCTVGSLARSPAALSPSAGTCAHGGGGPAAAESTSVSREPRHGHPAAPCLGTYRRGKQETVGTAAMGEGLGRRSHHWWVWQVVQESEAG